MFPDHIIVTEEKDGPNRTRIVPLFDEARDILFNRCLYKEANDFVFTYNTHTLYKHTKDAARAAELSPIVTVQSLRVTFGSSLIIRGIPISKVAKWMGHSTVTMTEKFYSDLLERDHKFWINKLKESNEKAMEQVI